MAATARLRKLVDQVTILKANSPAPLSSMAALARTRDETEFASLAAAVAARSEGRFKPTVHKVARFVRIGCLAVTYLVEQRLHITAAEQCSNALEVLVFEHDTQEPPSRLLPGVVMPQLIIRVDWISLMLDYYTRLAQQGDSAVKLISKFVFGALVAQQRVLAVYPSETWIDLAQLQDQMTAWCRSNPLSPLAVEQLRTLVLPGDSHSREEVMAMTPEEVARATYIPTADQKRVQLFQLYRLEERRDPSLGSRLAIPAKEPWDEMYDRAKREKRLSERAVEREIAVAYLEFANHGVVGGNRREVTEIIDELLTSASRSLEMLAEPLPSKPSGDALFEALKAHAQRRNIDSKERREYVIAALRKHRSALIQRLADKPTPR